MIGIIYKRNMRYIPARNYIQGSKIKLNRQLTLQSFEELQNYTICFSFFFTLEHM